MKATQKGASQDGVIEKRNKVCTAGRKESRDVPSKIITSSVAGRKGARLK